MPTPGTPESRQRVTPVAAKPEDVLEGRNTYMPRVTDARTNGGTHASSTVQGTMRAPAVWTQAWFIGSFTWRGNQVVPDEATPASQSA